MATAETPDLKKSTLCNMVIAAPRNEKCYQSVEQIVIKGRRSGLQFLTVKIVKPAAFSRNDGKDRELRTTSHPSRHRGENETVTSLTVTFAFLPAANFPCQ